MKRVSQTINLVITVLMILLVQTLASNAYAQKNGEGSNFPRGVQAEAGIGSGSAAIVNPDATTAYYSALSLEGRGHIPLYTTRWLGFNLVGNLRYVDLTNTADMGKQKEVANLIGPGLGVQLRLFKFIGGFQTEFLLARHYAVGPISRELNYTLNTTKTYYGFMFPFQNLAISFFESTSTGTVPNYKSGLSTSSQYSDQTYWLTLTYSTGASFIEFIKYLF